MKAITAKTSEAIKLTPAASPSSPSKRFTAFVIPISHKYVNGIDNIPKDKSGPNGLMMVSIRHPENTTNDAAINCPPNLRNALRPLMSSVIPIIRMKIVAVRMAK